MLRFLIMTHGQELNPTVIKIKNKNPNHLNAKRIYLKHYYLRYHNHDIYKYATVILLA